MPDPSTPHDATVARPLNRLGASTLSVVQTLLLAIAVLAINYLSFTHYGRADLSRSANYSLSSSTRGYLESPALQERGRPVRWVIAFRRTTPFYERVRALADEYARLSSGRIEVEVVDPLRSPNRMQEITAAYGITLMRDLLIIDSRPDDRPAVVEDANRVKSLNPHIKLVLADDMAVHEMVEGQRKITGFQGEDALTARLVESIEGRPKRMALLADKSRFTETGEFSPRKALSDKLRLQNIELTELRLAGLESVPEDIEGLVVAAPKHDLTREEVAVLEEYWARKRSAILVLTDSAGTPPNLRAFLRVNGVTPRQDRVIARGKDGLVSTARGAFTQGLPFMKDLAGQSTEFGGATASLEVREGAEDLASRKLYPMGLLEADPQFWGESDFGKGGEAFDEGKDQKSPFHLAACVIRGDEFDDRFAAETSRMVVIGNTDFLEPRHHRAENLDFLASSVNWLVGRESLAGASPRSLDMYRLPLLQAEISFINRVNLFFLPALLLLVGAFVWSSRRA